jgi:TM2 domain-containing membrane protein YozV
MINCYACGHMLHESAKACTQCGFQGVQFAPSHNRILAAMLALFLGGIGIHKFYLGRIGQGIVYLLFCWTLIPAFIAFIEAIVYLCTSDKDFARKYG